jgi:hypothetical protein
MFPGNYSLLVLGEGGLDDVGRKCSLRGSYLGFVRGMKERDGMGCMCSNCLSCVVFLACLPAFFATFDLILCRDLVLGLPLSCPFLRLLAVRTVLLCFGKPTYVRFLFLR